MARNFLIGIGGTGARVIESVVHMCASGYGPEELSIFMVDPDAGNGNLGRTKKLINEYIAVRARFKRTPSCPLFKTNIKVPKGEKEFVWEIFTDSKVTLSDYIGYSIMQNANPDQHKLASILFSQEELMQPLNEGFRGHPSIGAVVMANPDQDVYPFKMLWEDSDTKVNDKRVFMVGSVFGGTGAAGIPTLGSKNLIKYNEKAKMGDNGASKVVLGAALVLPYFNIEGDPDTAETMFVTANDFPIATKAALQYYNEKELGIDQMYLIGDSLGQHVGKFGVGSTRQNNMPHYIEVVSALAAFDFYGQHFTEELPAKGIFTASRADEEVNWGQLPYSRDKEVLRQKKDEFISLTTNMTVFSYAFLTYGQKVLHMNHKDILDAWYKDHFKFNIKDENDRLQDPRNSIIDELLSYLKKYLFWICALDDASDKVKLINRLMISSDELKTADVLDFKLEYPEDAKNAFNIGNILKNYPSKNFDFNQFKKMGLDSVQFSDKSVNDAFSVMANIFYKASVKFNELNYNIK